MIAIIFLINEKAVDQLDKSSFDKNIYTQIFSIKNKLSSYCNEIIAPSEACLFVKLFRSTEKIKSLVEDWQRQLHYYCYILLFKNFL
jgi:hypothetical protein